MRAVFLGTPSFGRTVLAKMVASGIEVPLVITQPDRERQQRGRGQAEASEVGAWAKEVGLNVLKPTKITEVRDEIEAAEADVAVVAAYGQLIPDSVLQTVGSKWVNVHGSLLPKYRGASPVQQAIIDGLDQTGVTIMEVVKELDAGPIISTARVPIKNDDTSGSLMDSIARSGAKLLVETLPAYMDGSLKPAPQDDTASTMTTQLKKSDGEIDWSQGAGFLERFIRAMQPWPGAVTKIDGQPITIMGSRVIDRPGNGEPGQFSESAPLVVAAGSGSLEITELKPAGKPAMAGEAWLRGRRRGGRFDSL